MRYLVVHPNTRNVLRARTYLTYLTFRQSANPAKMPLIPASGTGKFYAKSAKIIRFARQGCTNRPFFHIVVMERKKSQHQPVIEQVGTYDPLANEHNQRLVSFNFERVRHWLGNGAHLSTPVAELLGLSGLLPIHPRTYMTAWNRRKAIAAEEATNQSKEAATNS